MAAVADISKFIENAESKDLSEYDGYVPSSLKMQKFFSFYVQMP